MAWHHPGKILYENFLRPTNLSQNRLARAIEVPPRRINEIVLGKRAITADTAVRLGRYFGNGPDYWMKLQTDYDIALATNRIGIHLHTLGQHAPAPAPRSAQERETPPPAVGENRRPRNIKRRLLR